MTKNDLEYVIAMLKDTNLRAVARAVDLSYKTVWGISNGKNTAPSFTSVKKLADYFRTKA